MTAEERMRERAAQAALMPRGEATDLSNVAWPESATLAYAAGFGYALGQNEQAEASYEAIRALPLEGEQGEPVAGLWSVEPHGDGWALYIGRDKEHHGGRVCNLSDGMPTDYERIAYALNFAAQGEPANDQRGENEAALGVCGHSVGKATERNRGLPNSIASNTPHHSRTEQEAAAARNRGTSAPSREPGNQLALKCRYWDQWTLDECKQMAGGYLKQAVELDRLRAENEALHTRLEDNFCFDAEGNRKVVKPGSIPDGIECRNATIRIQDEILARLREKLAGGVVVPREAWTLALNALSEAEAILGGEYGDTYGVLCETMTKLETTLAAAKEICAHGRNLTEYCQPCGRVNNV